MKIQFSYIIQSKDNNLINKSSSGGMFAELARYILSKGGVVFGCAMERIEDGFDVKHIYIEDEKDLYKLQGSKYVQSRIGNTIKEAKKFLDEGRLVLFSGTPCQIAGLKAYLKQDYDNLLTVDLSCTGTPSLEIFNDYIKILETKYKQNIIKFEFRNKEKFGWSCGNALITLQNGKQKIIYNNLSSYLYLFINKKLQNESCQNCKFTGINRISDITVADAWGVENEYPELLKSKIDKNRGISLVFINSNKAIDLLNKIQNNLIIKEININKMVKYNNPLNKTSRNKVDLTYLNAYKNDKYYGIEKLFRKNLGKKYYYYILKNHTPKFVKNIIKLFLPKQEKVDCLLMTAYYWENYGSLLAAYSLYQTITNLGYKAKLIHYGNCRGFGKRFVKKYLPLTNRCVNHRDLLTLNKITDTFILGSDNLINLQTNLIENVAQNLFNFTSCDKKRLIISGSIGSWDGSTKNEEEHNYLKYLLDRFDYISTREEHGKKVLENTYNVNADWINDPVFYLNKKVYKELTKNVKQDYSNKIMQYILYPTKETDEIVNYYKEKLNTEIEKFDGNDNVKYFSCNKKKSVENWLSAIINSKLIITDSFHCTAFCLIFNRPFVCIKNTHATVRFTSLFKRLGINISLIEKKDDLNRVNLEYNTMQVNNELENIRQFALNEIQENLFKSKKDILQQNYKMDQYNKKIVENSTVWYKRNKLFYFGIIVAIIIPIKRVWADIRK